MRCGVYFNTTCRDSSACNAGRCASSLSITLPPLSAPRVLTKTRALLRSGETSTALMLTSAPSKLISRAMMPLSSRFTNSFTRNCRCFMNKMICHPERSKRSRRISPRDSSTALGMTTSQFLGDLLELIALDHVAYLIFAEVAQLDTAFQTGSDFFDVVLKTAKRRNPAIVNRLSSSQNASAPDARNPAVGHETTSDDASAQLENLFHLSVSDDGFTQLRFQQTGHGVFDLIKQLINNAVKLDLHAFAFCSRHCHGFNLHVKTDHYCLGCAGEQNIRFRDRSDR